jgi:antitoxin component YwqK of YwqJK toxin-antitoxin module
VKTTKTFYLFPLLLLFSCADKNQIEVKQEHYSDGGLKSIKRYKEGKIAGQAQWFYPDGKLEQTVIFKDGTENGNGYYFYPSGAIKSHRHWRDGKMNGYVADYYDDTVGIIKSVLIYNNNGSLIYKKTFDSLGRVMSEEGKKPDAP